MTSLRDRKQFACFDNSALYIFASIFLGFFFTMPHCMVPECTNNSRKTKGISYHRVPKENQLQRAWMARIRRANPRNVATSYVCSAHFTPECFEKKPFLSGHQSRPRLKPDAIPSIFSRNKPEKRRETGRRRTQLRSEQAMHEVLKHMSKCCRLTFFIVVKISGSKSRPTIEIDNQLNHALFKV